MKFDPFVLPFTAGLMFLLVYLAFKYALWYFQLSGNDRRMLIRGMFSLKIFKAIREVLEESLLHKSIFKTNRLLGFMHMSLAFGWFLLIVIGNLESRVFDPLAANPPYVAIFFRFFEANPGAFPFHRVFSFTMDLLLLFVLTGVILAYIKRFYSKAYGMRKTTRLRAGDRFALTALWLIFPFRLLAESLTSAAFGGGDFLTGSFGTVLGLILPAGKLYYPAWWAYSLSLGVFFTALPFSRYMHIPTEVVLILSRCFGFKESSHRTPFTEIEINSCSRCGICLDACQLSFAGGIHTIQSAYQLKAIRYNHINPIDSFTCMMCGRCGKVCPVGIDINSIRMISRNELNGRVPDPSFKIQQANRIPKADVIYFAGCMSHQTPSIKRSMEKILNAAGINFWFMDEEGGLCCGRPMKLTGHSEQAEMMIAENKRMIMESGASVFVTSCPICYKIFKKDYDLPIKVMHHTQYILELVKQGNIQLSRLEESVVYHDPCELSRDLEVYEEPRELLGYVVQLIKTPDEKDETLCCGGSLASFSSGQEMKGIIAKDAWQKIMQPGADQFVTSCPLCKKSFDKVSEVPVKDVSEIICRAMITSTPELITTKGRKNYTENPVIYSKL